MALSNQASKYMRHQFRNRVRDQKGLATWVKIMIAVMVVGTIAILGLVIGGAVILGGAYSDMQNPKKIKETADSIAKFADPLPEGWKMITALNILGVTSVAILDNQKEKIVIDLLKLPNPSKGTSDDVINSYAEKGVPSFSSTGAGQVSAPVSIKDKGQMKVGGEDMTYAVGTSEKSGKTFSQLIGFVMPKSSANAVIFHGVCESPDFKLEKTKELLSTIKGF